MGAQERRLARALVAAIASQGLRGFRARAKGSFLLEWGRIGCATAKLVFCCTTALEGLFKYIENILDISMDNPLISQPDVIPLSRKSPRSTSSCVA